MVDRLFVYGTLGPGRPNAHVLEDIGGEWAQGSVRGSLHDEGWGAAMGYPGIVLDKAADSIEGFVFSSPNLAAHWDVLDRFEGEAYERVIATVSLPDGATIQAFIYALRG